MMHPRADVWRSIGRQLAHPSGQAGRFIAHLLDYTNAAPLRETIGALEPSAATDVLEIGFGSGRGVEALLAAYPRCCVAGIDRSAEMVRMAARRNALSVASGRLRLVQGSAATLPWPPAAFDRVLAVNVAYFFAEGGCEMAEAHRVLRPGGRIALYVTSKSSMQSWRFASDATHRTYDEADLAALMRETGFEKVAIKPLDLPLGIVGLIAVGTKPRPDGSAFMTTASRPETGGGPIPSL